MYIIIVGGGRLGYYLLKALLNEGNEVLLMEKEAYICETINEEMGSVCFRGDGCEAATMEEVGTGRADMLVAVTGDDEDNLIACQVAKHKFNVPTTITRIRNPQNEILFKKLGVDVTISSTQIILEYIGREIPTHPLTHLLTLRDKGLEIVDIRISPESITVGKTIKEIDLPKESKLALVIPVEHAPHAPTASTVLHAGDRIIALTTHETEEALRSSLRGA
jgi:trk system potassium uptake protein TrkA